MHYVISIISKGLAPDPKSDGCVYSGRECVLRYIHWSEKCGEDFEEQKDQDHMTYEASMIIVAESREKTHLLAYQPRSLSSGARCSWIVGDY